MISKEMTVDLECGLEARPVAKFVQEAGLYDCDIYITYEGKRLDGTINTKRVNAKSIMGMMSLGVSCGGVITVEADGHDEEEAIRGLEAFLKQKEL